MLVTILLWIVLAISVVTGLVAWFLPRKKNDISQKNNGAVGNTQDETIRPQYSLLPAPRDEIAETYGKLSETARCDLVLAIDNPSDPRSQRILDLAREDASEAVALAALYIRESKTLPLLMEVFD